MFYYNRDGSVIEGGTLAWAKQFEHDDRLVAAQSLWFKNIRVSTVWLGMDHDFRWTDIDTPNPHPIIFESLVFLRGRGNGEMRRYETEAEALAGHKALVRAYRNPITAIKELWSEWRRH